MDFRSREYTTAPQRPKLTITYSSSVSDTESPSAPANLLETVKSATTVSLSWTASTDNVGVTEYAVYRDSVQAGTAAGTSFTDTGLNPITSYTYQVTARDAAGNESGPSGSLVVLTNPLTNQAPLVLISSPANGALFSEGASVAFVASASDVEDGDLTASLSWTSSLDGAIGGGGAFSAVLSVGTHTITAAVTDSGGLAGADVITLTVSAPGQQFDPAMAWPLCGRINEATPAGWVESDGCPVDRWNDPSFSDLPVHSPFGPRRLASESDRYDFHRGIDLATPTGTPVFAVAGGTVIIAGDHPSYSDPLVQLRHFRPGETSCDSVGCYHSNYMHLSQALVAEDDVVSKGDLIGYTGASASLFEHLHFEIRNAPAFDTLSRWQRDAINSLGVLPYQDSSGASVTFGSVDTSNPAQPVVSVTVQTSHVDVQRVELTLTDSGGTLIPQSGNVADARGYNVNPSWFGMNEWNFQYTHKDSTNVPWGSFGAGGVNECPYHPEHPASYDAHIHMDKQKQDPQDPQAFQVGLFNGVEIYRPPIVAGIYSLELTFHELQGPADCFSAEVFFAAGGSSTAEWGNCAGSTNVPPTVTVSSPANGASFTEGTSVAFAASATDAEDGDLTASLAWTSSLDGAIGTGGAFSAVLSVGTHTITAAVTDSGGQSGSDVITVTVAANVPPAVTISSPANGASFSEGTSVAFAASATDAEDGDLTASLSWTSSLDGPIGAGGSFSAVLSVGAHTITAAVTDSGSLSGSDVITVTVAANVAPAVTVSSPANGASFTEGTSVAFAASATDAEDGDLTASLSWTSSLDGAIGAGGGFSAVLSVGAHTITATATDSGSLSGSDIITVTVAANIPPAVTISSPADGSSFADGTSIAFSGTAIDVENGDLTAGLSWVSNLDNAIGSGGGFSTSLSVGTHVVTASVSDSGGLLGSATINVTVEVLPPSGLAVEPVVVPNVSNTAWTAVSLSNTYSSMVVVCSPNYDSSSAPLTPRVRNAAGSGFDLRVDRVDGSSAAPISGVPVHCVAAEEGVYNTADHGVKMEAVKYTSTVTDRAASWVGESRSYANSYTSPVVIGQVMSYNDPAFSVFWARGASRTAPPSSSTLFTGKNVAEDPNQIRADEIVGYIVIESGTGTIGALEYTAAAGSDTIRGTGNAPPYSYAIGGLTSVSSAIVSAAAMDGNNGGWPILHGLNPVTTGGLQLSFDEDQINDPERSHTTEQVAYLVLGTTVPVPTLQSITVAPAAPSIEAGQTQQFTATGNYSDSSTQDLSATAAWSSSNPAAAGISASGLANGVAAGASNISASQGGVVSNTAVLTVTPPTLQSITVAPAAPSIEAGQTQQFTATGNYSDSSTQQLESRGGWNQTSATSAPRRPGR